MTSVPPKNPKIVIVGAGAAGIAAATKLIEHGINDVTILEAENRIGGRVQSVDFGGTIVDLGAQWVHGEEDNIVYEMVKDLNLVSPSKTSNYKYLSFYTSDNSNINKNLTDLLHDVAEDILEDDKSASEYEGTYGEYFSEAFNDKILAKFGDSNKDILNLAKMVEEWYSKFSLCIDPAETWHHMCASGPYQFQRCKGNQLLNWQDKGYGTIFDVLMKKIPDKFKELPLENKIVLNKEVEKIIWCQKSQVPKVTVRCSDGSSYEADNVIVTVSVGVLKEIHDKMFSPKLPENKINAIKCIPLGTVGKIMLKFPEKWWPDDLKDISLLWTTEDKEKLLEEFPLGPVHNGRSWLEDVFGFYTVDSHPRILLGWVVGPMIKEVEMLSDKIVQDGCMFLLTKFVGKKFNLVQPESMLRSNWGTNSFFRGSYSYVSSEMEKSEARHEDLAQPLSVDGREVVLFAGEATHCHYFSTVHGAIESGYREANRLIEIYKIITKKLVIRAGQILYCS